MQRVKLPNGDAAEFPDGMAKDKIEAVVRKQFPLKGAEGFDLGFVDAEGPENPEGLKRTLRLIAGLEKPQSADEAILMTLGTAPAFLAGGAGAVRLATMAGAPAAIVKLAPTLGRMLTAGGLAKARGEDNFATGIDVAGAGIAEGAMAGAGKLLSTPAKAMDAILERLVRGKTWKGADASRYKAWLDKEMEYVRAGDKTTVGPERARKLAKELNDMDPEGVAGKIYLQQIERPAKAHVGPVKLPMVHVGRPSVDASQTARTVTSNPSARSLADAALGQPPNSALAVSAIPELAAKAHVPGARRVVDVIEEAE